MRRNNWAAYGACAWALAFALMSFYWAAGGLAAIDTIGGEPSGSLAPGIPSSSGSNGSSGR
jgi:hypothetical protein